MSDNVLSYGVFYKIKNGPLDYEEVSEALYEADTFFNLNYEGTLLYTDMGGGNIYGLHFHEPKPLIGEDIRLLQLLHGIEVDESSGLAYSCVWYNGADSYMSELTLKEYEEIAEKQIRNITLEA